MPKRSHGSFKQGRPTEYPIQNLLVDSISLMGQRTSTGDVSYLKDNETVGAKKDVCPKDTETENQR